ncbi:hypothetical protein LWM68_17970 [Niabella sp. W65]|nr:hypothetical protein [Niabella sp. W65]MCH7364468.1 hypothetical protein [Niabella sp. W65]
MLYCSFGNGLRLTGDPSYNEVLLTGAKSLATRYKPQVGLIRSWDHNKKLWQYPVIIDNIMNLELLLWASRYSGDPVFKQIAISHADKTMQYHFRPDYSSYHVVSYDTISGQPHLKQTHQELPMNQPGAVARPGVYTGIPTCIVRRRNNVTWNRRRK